MDDENNITITISDEDYKNYSIDMTQYTSTILGGTGASGTTWGNLTSGTYNGTSASNYYGNTNYTISSNTARSGLSVTGDAEFEGDVKIKGVSIVDAIEKINQRLAILVPDPAKLEHFEALKRAYENYKTLEALCELPKKDE